MNRAARPALKPAPLCSESLECDVSRNSEKISPLAYMLSVLADESADVKRRDDMAKAAAPYMHPRLSNLDHGGQLALSHEDALDKLS